MWHCLMLGFYLNTNANTSPFTQMFAWHTYLKILKVAYIEKTNYRKSGNYFIIAYVLGFYVASSSRKKSVKGESLYFTVAVNPCTVRSNTVSP